MFFSGTAGPRQKVSLGGRSRAEAESREQLLDKARKEREARARAKLEHRAALSVQAVWRGRHDAQACREAWRAEWAAAYEALDSPSLASALSAQPRCLQLLMAFFDPAQDLPRLGRVCRALAESAGAGSCGLLAAAASAAVGEQASGDRAAPSAASLALHRLKRLAATALATVAAHPGAAAADLGAPFAALPASHSPAAGCVDLLIRLANPVAWQPSLAAAGAQAPPPPSAEAAAAGAGAVLAHLYHRRLYGQLVPRLWFGCISPLHLTTPGGFLCLGASSEQQRGSGTSISIQGEPGLGAAGPGAWLCPLLVLCQAYVAALSFTHLEDFFADAAPSLVPLQQLYSEAAPGAGLLLLLKAAAWQILWCGGVSPAAAAPPACASPQLARLKSAAGEVCGLLLCQLHDRNCTRAFAPAAAFLADGLSPARLQAEVAAAVRGGLGVLGADSDEEGDGGAGTGTGAAPPAAAAAGIGSVDEADEDVLDADEAGEAAGAAAAGAGAGARHGGRTSAGGQAGAGAGAGAVGGRVWLVLRHAPCLIPFQERVKLFQSALEAEKAAAAEASAAQQAFVFDDPLDFFQNGPGAGGNRFFSIRRDQLLDDGFAQLGALAPDALKGRLRISYVNEAGLAEAGIDGGGLFKDFMEELLKQGFSPQSRLFAENPQHQLYPSPAAFQLAPDAQGQLEFLGRMLGKSLYEGMLLELPLAAFFLKKMRGGVCDVNDLPSLDPEVYTHLLQLRHYNGDFAALSLSFTATVVDQAPPGSSGSSSASSCEVELKPGGRDTPVTADNVVEYVHRLADFRLNRQMDRAAAAFLRGFFSLVKPRWVRCFNEAELQALISGSEEGVDLGDLQAHVNYAGGYHEEHPVIVRLWGVLRALSAQEQRLFLKFVTSCSRPPLLGFAYLEPRICIQMSGGVLQPETHKRLPTAATCMNLLKLPPYDSPQEMRRKLITAITSGAGFELS